MTKPKTIYGQGFRENLTAKTKMEIAIPMQTIQISFKFYNNLIVLVDTFCNTYAFIWKQIKCEFKLNCGTVAGR